MHEAAHALAHVNHIPITVGANADPVRYVEL